MSSSHKISGASVVTVVSPSAPPKSAGSPSSFETSPTDNIVDVETQRLKCVHKRALSSKTYTRVLSVVELEELAKKSSKKLVQIREKLQAEGWEDVTGTLTVVTPKSPTGCVGATLKNLPTEVTMLNLLKKVFDHSFIDALREAHPDLDGARGPPFTKTERVLQYLAFRIYNQAVGQAAKHGFGRRQAEFAFYRAQERFVQKFDLKQPPMGYKTFAKFLSHFYITSELAHTELSLRLQQFITLGESLVLYEKNKKWRGGSECIRDIPHKPDPIGQWTSQVCAFLNDTSASYCLGMYSFRSGKNSHTQVFLADVACFAVTPALSNPKKTRPILISDGFYPCGDVRGVLRAAGLPYHVAVSHCRLPEAIVSRLQGKVTEKGQWAAMHNKTTGETILHSWSSRQNVGKKWLLSTILKPTSEKRTPGYIPGEETYATLASACDLFNMDSVGSFWPFRLKDNNSSFDDLYFSTILKDLFAILLETSKNPSGLDFREELIKLADAVFECSFNDGAGWSDAIFVRDSTQVDEMEAVEIVKAAILEESEDKLSAEESEGDLSAEESKGDLSAEESESDSTEKGTDERRMD